jgi:NAD(P)-dependent dehydrogenase (short-subunit alcohol dehydrogenase family)
MSEVRRLAGEFKAKYPQLDVLINNAGAVFTKRLETVDGYEMTFALNHLSYFLLTNLLIDSLKSPPAARIVNVSSGAHTGGHIDFDDLQNKKGYGMQGFRAYSNSKLANVLFTYELARRLDGSTVTANALEPGVVATGFGHNNSGLLNWALSLFQFFSKTPAQGAETVVYLASSPEVQVVSGKYFADCKPVDSSADSKDPAIAKRLWEESVKLTGLTTTI